MLSSSHLQRHVASLAVAALLCGANVAVASPLIAFTDGSSGSSSAALLSDDDANWAVSWTQTTTSTNVTLNAILSSNVGVTAADWYVTDAIGAGTTAANVLYSGTYSLTSALTSSQQADFNTAPRTVLGTGLSFGAGTYYLVLDGPPGPFVNNANWIGDFTGMGTTLAPGFSVGDYFSSSSVNSFAPASDFTTLTSSSRFVFELETATVPEPASLALLSLGLAGLGFVRRNRGDGSA